MLERYVLPSLPKIDSAADQPDISLCVVRVAKNFQLSVDDAVVASAYRAISLVPALIKVLDDAVVQRLTGLHAVHAGIVQWGAWVSPMRENRRWWLNCCGEAQPIFPMSMR